MLVITPAGHKAGCFVKPVRAKGAHPSRSPSVRISPRLGILHVGTVFDRPFVYQRLAARSHIEQPPPGTACRRLSLALRPVPSFCAVFDLIRFVTVRLLVVFEYLDFILLAFTVCFCVHALPMYNFVIMYTDSD